MAYEDWFAAPFYNDLLDVALAVDRVPVGRAVGREGVFNLQWTKRTFLPSGICPKSISTFACASTSAEADMLTRKSVHAKLSDLLSTITPSHNH